MLNIKIDEKIYSEEEVLEAFVVTFHKRGDFDFPRPPASELECDRATLRCWECFKINLDRARSRPKEAKKWTMDPGC